MYSVSYLSQVVLEGCEFGPQAAKSGCMSFSCYLGLSIQRHASIYSISGNWWLYIAPSEWMCLCQCWLCGHCPGCSPPVAQSCWNRLHAYTLFTLLIGTPRMLFWENGCSPHIPFMWNKWPTVFQSDGIWTSFCREDKSIWFECLFRPVIASLCVMCQTLKLVNVELQSLTRAAVITGASSRALGGSRLNSSTRKQDTAADLLCVSDSDWEERKTVQFLTCSRTAGVQSMRTASWRPHRADLSCLCTFNGSVMESCTLFYFFYPVQESKVVSPTKHCRYEELTYPSPQV